jgi:hypothetical protein
MAISDFDKRLEEARAELKAALAATAPAHTPEGPKHASQMTPEEYEEARRRMGFRRQSLMRLGK